MGQELSRAIPELQDADALTRCGRQQPEERFRKFQRSPARSLAMARRDTPCTEYGN